MTSGWCVRAYGSSLRTVPPTASRCSISKAITAMTPSHWTTRARRYPMSQAKTASPARRWPHAPNGRSVTRHPSMPLRLGSTAMASTASMRTGPSSVSVTGPCVIQCSTSSPTPIAIGEIATRRHWISGGLRAATQTPGSPAISSLGSMLKTVTKICIASTTVPT